MCQSQLNWPKKLIEQVLKFKDITRVSLIFICLWLVIFPAKAQSPFIQKIRFSIPTKEPVFNKAFQDDKGFIWLGSDNGLFRFDGISFRQYFSPIDSIDLQVTAIHEGPDGVLWVGCKDGKIYWLDEGVISLFNPVEGTAGKAISDIITDKEGVLWWSTIGEGIYFYNHDRVFNINHDDGLNEDYVYDLECDHTGLIWAGTDAGIAACRQTDGIKSVKPLEIGKPLPDIIVRVIKEDPSGRLWLGFQDGGAGYLLPDRSDFRTPYPDISWPYGPVQDLAVLRDALWIATVSGELLEIDPGNATGAIQRVTNKDSFKYGKINDLLEDTEGNAWILSYSGLYRTSGTRLKFYNQVNGADLQNIHAVRHDLLNHNNLWFSDDEGIFLLYLSDGSIKRYLEGFNLPNLKVMCLFQDNQGYIWAGTFNYGVFRIHPDNGSWIQITEKQGLINNNVLSISGHIDTLWMATLGGASEIILQGRAPDGPFLITSHNRDNGLVNNFIYSVFEDTHDQVWFATDGDGISVKTKSGWISYDEKNGLGDDVIYSITGDQRENIWIASASDGIYKYNGGKFSHFGIKDGLSSLEITGITTSGDEVIIIHDDGLDVLHISSGRIAHYGEEVGLAGISPDLNVISKDPGGNVWIGTRTGIIRYQPGTNAESYGPRTVLEEMSVYLEPRLMKKDLILGFSENNVSFKYSGLWLSNPEAVTYQVMLEGYDLEWKNTFDRSVTYSSLPPGIYTFRVRSSLDQSFHNASEATYEFRIKGPFWLSAWFMILVIVALAAVIYFIVRYREERMRRIEQQKKEKVEFEFQVLKNQVNPHFLFNSFSTLMALIEEKSDQALKYTEKLSDFFRIILQLRDEEVIPIKDEISLIDNYYFLLKKRFGENLHLDISLGKDIQNSFIPPMTLQILIENAVKHNIISKDKPLHIRIYEQGGRIIVENDLRPKKISEISTGIGLENISKRYRLITAKEPEMEKTEDIFRVKLPIITTNH